jgi:O-acetyl-ADP-ribose deacetylase (regulator of RNase III)
MKIIHGDLLQHALEGAFDVIVHGANCQCVMGAGIARAIRAAFPEAYAADLATARGDRAKLGTLSVAEVTRASVRFSLVNAYTQFHYRGSGTRVDYEAVRAAMKALKRGFHGKRIGYPMIGAGLGRGDWGRIAHIIDEELAREDHTLVMLA